MNNLPQEIIDRIVFHTERYEGLGYLPVPLQYDRSPSKFPALATISACRKEAIESFTFRAFHVNNDALDQFQTIVIGARRKYLKHLRYIICLPDYLEEAYRRVEAAGDQRLDNQFFSRSIADLFSILRSWESDGLETRLKLSLAYVHCNIDSRSRYQNRFRLQEARRQGREDILERRYEESLLQLLPLDRLPILSNVTCLDIRGNSMRKIAPCTGPDLARLLPNLDTITWEFGDCDSQSARMRCNNRIAFAHNFSQLNCLKLSSVNIDFYHEFPQDQRLSGQDIVPTGLLYDPFSAALRTFSQNLTSFQLSAHLDSTIFWPSKDEENIVIPTWPCLRNLDITFNMVTPFGDWNFTGPYEPQPEDRWSEDDSDYDNYRVNAIPEKMDPFVSAVAKAVHNMPVLQHFALNSELGPGKGRFHIFYYGPGRYAEWGDEGQMDLQVRRLYFEVGKVWRPEPETLEGLRYAGKEKYGGEIIEKFFEF